MFKTDCLIAATIVVGVVRIGGQGESLAPADCTVDRLQQKAPQGTTITRAAMVEATATVPHAGGALHGQRQR